MCITDMDYMVSMVTGAPSPIHTPALAIYDGPGSSKPPGVTPIPRWEAAPVHRLAMRVWVSQFFFRNNKSFVFLTSGLELSLIYI